MKQFRKWFQNITLYKKIFMIVLVLTGVICVVFFGGLEYLIHNYEEKLFDSTAKNLYNTTADMKTNLDDIATMSDYIIRDTEIQENLMILIDPTQKERQGGAKRKAYEALYAYFNAKPYIKSICLVVDDYAISMGENLPLNQEGITLLHEKALETQGRVFWETGGLNGTAIACARQIRQIKYSKFNKLGVLYITVDLDKLVHTALTKSGFTSTKDHFILFSGEDQIYPVTEQPEQTILDLRKSIQVSQDVFYISTVHQRKQFITPGVLTDLQWDYLFLQDYDQLFKHIRTIKTTTFVVALMFFILALYMTRLILISVFKHLDYLVYKIQQFGEGVTFTDDENERYNDRQDEIGQLHKTFDEMTKSVKVLRDENYDKQLLLHDATIKMLEQQINPHFLYNTLDTINWMAQSYGAKDISLMVRSLGNIFRASIANKKELILLSEELSFLENYIQIQKIRFKDRLTFQIITPSEISEILVPKLCIQPLVENALKYALECSDEPCTILVKVEEREQTYEIQVANSGSVFEANLINKLENHTWKARGEGVGLVNINSRMRLIYGEDYGLKIFNEDGMAVVILTIPHNSKRREPHA